MFQKTLGLKCKTKINLYKFVSGIHAPCYLRFLVQFHTGSLEHHIHWFCLDDLSHCVGGTTQKYVVVRPLMPTIWLIQEGTNLTQKEVITIEEVGFSFDRSCVQSLFGSQLSSTSNSHVVCMSAHNIVRSVDASCWPTTCGGKKVKQPSIFKTTQH